VSHWRRSPRPLGASLGALQDRLAPASLLAEAQLVWPRAVGSAIAAEASPVSERGGVLTVSCSASVWAQELELMAPGIIERLNELLSGGQVARLRCVAVPGRG
jgi:predicted nucleic acid-binding Zn ribbon protein